MAGPVCRGNKHAVSLILTVVLVTGMAVWANPPETVNVNGSLADAGGIPLTGARVFQVRMFDAETEGTQLGADLAGTVELSAEGLFSLPMVLPPEALAAAELWYELAIDTDVPPDGDATDDLFPGRIRVHSVPFALEAGTVLQVDAGTIGNGMVDNDEYGRLDGVTAPIQSAIDTKADAAALTAHADDLSNPHGVTKAQVGLGDVDNTSDLAKPVSLAAQDALNAKADVAALTAHADDLANPHGVTKAQVGLGEVDNTSDLAKPVSTATQAALNAKANAAALTSHTGNVTNPHAVTKTQVGLGDVDNTSDMDKPVSTAAQAALDTKADDEALTSHTDNLSNPHGVTKEQLGLENVDNTTDLDKPVSTAVQTALDADSAALTTHTDDMSNPHGVTKEQVGLANVDDTSDADKPVSIAAQAALDEKLPRVSENCVVVKVTSDAEVNGTNLLAAYEEASALRPYGIALGPTNRAVVLVPPGKYNLVDGPLTMDTEYVDLVGLSTASDDQYICRDFHVLVQTAKDVHIENLVFHYTGWSGAVFAYQPGANWDDGVPHTGSPAATRIRNCKFRANIASMREGVEYAGTYENCTAEGAYTFGGNASGVASGTFINCKGGVYAFGSVGLASGTFVNCTGGDFSFGYNGTASGVFTNCTGGNESFGLIASGTFTNCTGADNAFGGASGSADGGKFYYCVGGANSFATAGAPAPMHLYCVRDNVAWP